jgi:hypothetical protein
MDAKRPTKANGDKFDYLGGGCVSMIFAPKYIADTGKERILSTFASIYLVYDN